MSNLLNYVNSAKIKQIEDKVSNEIGDLSQLQTENKDNLVESVNETVSQLAQTTEELEQKMDKNTNDISIYQINKNKGLIDETYLHDDLKAQMAGNTPIHSTPAKGSITKDRFAPRSVGIDQTNFISRGVNLFDKDDVLNGYIISPDGNISENDNYLVSDYILVHPNTYYYFNHPTSIIGWYSDSFEFISRIYQESGAFESPSTARYMRVSVPLGGANTLQVSEGDEHLPYEDFKIYSEKLRVRTDQIEGDNLPLTAIKEVSLGKNLFDKSKVIVGRISPDSGNIDSSLDNYRTSDYIEVEPNVYYSKSHNAPFAFFDENKNFIEIPYDGTQYGSAVSSFPAPENAKYIRVSCLISDVDHYQFEKGSEPTEYEPFGYRIDRLLVDQVNGNLKPQPPLLTPPSLYDVELESTDVAGVPIIAYFQEGIIYGRRGLNVYKSTDKMETWEHVLTLDADGSIQSVIVTNTNRIIVATNHGEVYVSDEEQTTFSSEPAITFSAGTVAFNRGFRVYNNIVLLGSYGAHNADNPPSEVYLSTDSGVTFERIFDKSNALIEDIAGFHFHDVEYDPYQNRIWVWCGDWDNTNLYYTDNWGRDWHNVFEQGSSPKNTTHLLSTPHGLFLGSDRNPDGLGFLAKREGTVSGVPSLSDYQEDYLIFSGEEEITNHVAGLGWADRINGIYAIPFYGQNDDGFARILMSYDGLHWSEVFRGTNPNSGMLTVFVDGEYLYGRYDDGNERFNLKAKIPTAVR